jgi:hypothetical protein
VGREGRDMSGEGREGCEWGGKGGKRVWGGEGRGRGESQEAERHATTVPIHQAHTTFYSHTTPFAYHPYRPGGYKEMSSSFADQ